MPSTVKIGFVPSIRHGRSHIWGAPLRERTIKALATVPGLELVVPDESVTPYGCVQNDDQAVAAIAYFQDKGIDGVLVGGMDFADEISAATVAAAMNKPVLLFATKEGELRPDGERVSDSFCGSLSIGVALHRRKTPFTMAGLVWPEEPAFLTAVEDFARGCHALKYFRGARVGQIGVRPERFETVAYNEPLLVERFGIKIVPIAVSQMTQQALAISEEDPEIAAIIREITAQAGVLNVGSRSLLRMAQYELAVVRWMQARNLSAMAQFCGAVRPLMGIAVCSTLGRLTDRGLMASCETDVLGALDMLVQYNTTLKQIVPHFIDWTVQHRLRENVFLAWHCGNAPMSLKRPGTVATLRARGRALDAPIPDGDEGAGTWDATLRTGPVTITRLVEYDGEYKMLITEGAIIDDPAQERGSGSWVEVPDLEKLYMTLFEEGFIHHASMIHGRYTGALAQFCKFAGIKTVIV